MWLGAVAVLSVPNKVLIAVVDALRRNQIEWVNEAVLKRGVLVIARYKPLTTGTAEILVSSPPTVNVSTAPKYPLVLVLPMISMDVPREAPVVPVLSGYR